MSLSRVVSCLYYACESRYVVMHFSAM